MVVEKWEGKDGGVARCRAKAGEYGNAERASRSSRIGQAGQGCDCGGAETSSCCWAWLTRCPGTAEAEGRGRGTDRVAVRPRAGACLLLLLLLVVLLLLHATQSCCVLLVAAVTKKGSGDWGAAEKVGKTEQSLRRVQGRGGRGERNVTPTIDKRRARGDCKMRKPTLEAIRMGLVTMMRGI